MYTLEHNMGEATFQTIKDAIIAMYLIARYDPECDAEFTETKAEIDSISNKVEDGKYYINGIFTLFKSEY